LIGSAAWFSAFWPSFFGGMIERIDRSDGDQLGYSDQIVGDEIEDEV
jgi:hypothetical protein